MLREGVLNIHTPSYAVCLRSPQIDDAAVSAFRARLAQLPRKKHGSECFEESVLASLSDADCRRYLRARDGKVEAAAAMACASLDWRVQMEIDKVGPADIPIALAQVRPLLPGARACHAPTRFGVFFAIPERQHPWHV
jgi:hypothetical protein